MSNTVRNIEISKAEEVGAAIIDEQPQDYSIVQEWADKLGIELPQESAHVTPIKELSALVKGLVRKVLNMFLPQIVNKTEEIYSHLDSRCTDYTPAAYAPMGTPPTPRTLPNLLQALTAFAPRKISNGSAPADGIPDGVSLAHLLFAISTVTKLWDDNHGWDMIYKVTDKFGSLSDVKLGCKTINIAAISRGVPAVTATGAVEMSDLETSYMADYDAVVLRGGSGDTLNFHKLTSIRFGAAYSHFIDNCNYENLIFPVLTNFQDGNYYYGNSTGIVLNSPGVKYIECTVLPKTNGSDSVNLFYNNQALEEIYLPGFTNHNISIMRNCPALKKLTLGKITAWSVPSRGDWDAEYDEFKKEVNLIDIVFGEGSAANINLANWNPTNVLADADKTATFLQNFKEHIALRLTDQGSGKTLTLSQAVYDAVKGTNGGYASTHTLGEICGESLVLTPLEIALGITENTLYSTWLTTYFGENGINWNIETPN